MGVETIRSVEDIRPIHRGTDARQVALAAYDRLAELLADLTAEEWAMPTECTGWDVAAMVGHLVGAGKAGASVREQVRQQLWGKRHADEFGGNVLDAANERQVRDHAHLTSTERVSALRDVAPRAVRGRMKVPAPLRRVSVPLDPGGSTAEGMPNSLALGHLMDVVYTRDVWLHTIDIARAVGRPYTPDPAVDGRIVEDVVAEWARRHREPVALVLTGPAGGRFQQGEGGGYLNLDAIEFGRVLSGRADPEDVKVIADPPATSRLLGTRVVF